jgi:hypothetical protein
MGEPMCSSIPILIFNKMNIEHLELIEDILEVNRRVCSALWDVSNVNSIPKGLSPRLIFPQKRDEKIRVSEQEARILYCGILNNLNYFYSIETPTTDTYQQTGMQPVSASSDLSLYREKNNHFDKVMNIEFKAHNPEPEDIRKDIEKLIRERIAGNWFHVLKNADSGTLPALFGKMRDSLLACEHFLNSPIYFIFCFCVLEKSWACMKHFYYNPKEENFQKYLDDFFAPYYSVRAGKREVSQNNSWNITRKDILR